MILTTDFINRSHGLFFSSRISLFLASRISRFVADFLIRLAVFFSICLFFAMYMIEYIFGRTPTNSSIGIPCVSGFIFQKDRCIRRAV